MPQIASRRVVGRRTPALWLALAFVGSSAGASAQTFYPHIVIPDARTVALGGAGVVLGRGPSVLSANPALLGCEASVAIVPGSIHTLPTFAGDVQSRTFGVSLPAGRFAVGGQFSRVTLELDYKDRRPASGSTFIAGVAGEFLPRSVTAKKR